jgi:hypothetical protein
MVGDLRSKSEFVPLGDAELVQAEINMAAGELASAAAREFGARLRLGWPGGSAGGR